MLPKNNIGIFEVKRYLFKIRYFWTGFIWPVNGKNHVSFRKVSPMPYVLVYDFTPL